MIYSLKERSNTIYHYVENYLDKDTFNHNFSLDMKNDTYKQIKQKLEDVKNATNVLYLYTAKMTDEGEIKLFCQIRLRKLPGVPFLFHITLYTTKEK